MQRIVSEDAEIFYEVTGSGRSVVLLHPFPANHELWLPVAQMLGSRYRLIMPDLRGHGESSIGEGPATMHKHARDVARVMDGAGEDHAPLVAVSIGGYLIFDFYSRVSDRRTPPVLCNTKAHTDHPKARAN